MAHLFEDIFLIKEKDPGGKRFDKVSRFVCMSEHYDMELHIDINTDIYPLSEGNKFTLTLSSTLHPDGTPMPEDENFWDKTDQPTLMDRYEYVMYGKVFRYLEDKAPSQKISVFISFGGLLMMLKGDARNISQVELDSNVYLLMRKI